MRQAIVLLALLIGTIIQAQPSINIIPQPASLQQSRAGLQWTLTPSTLIVLSGSNLENAVGFFNDYLERYYGFKLKTAKTGNGTNTIRLNYERIDGAIPGAYKMNVDDKGIDIAGDNEHGVFYGIQSLIQLLPLPAGNSTKLEIPYVKIEDAPRFAYRGLHLDVARHFMPVEFIKKYIDYIALHKMNFFHWHLTEDQGWRIEIKRYPKLTSVGGWRNGTIIGRYPGTGNDGIRYGGFYTQDQVKDIVAYAQKRYVTVVPEIELPGHSSAAIAAYPELSCFPSESTKHPPVTTWHGDTTGKQVQQVWGVFDDVFCAGQDNTFNFLQDVLDEVLALFPSTYIHVGGDECPKANWKRCPNCQKRINDFKLHDEHGLQSYFIQRIEKYLNKKGRKLIGWDEILEGGLAPNALVMSWRGEEGGIAAAKEKHEVIMTPGNPVYFDHTQSPNEDSVTIGGFNPIEKVYAYEPVPKELNAEQAKYVLGAQANVWTEYMKNTRKVEYMIFPRVSALSEVLWTAKEKKNWADFEKRLAVQFKRYDLWKANYSKAYFDLKTSVMPTADYKGVIWKLESKNTTNQLNWFKKLEASDPPNPPAFYSYTVPIRIEKSGEYSAWSVEDGKHLQNTIIQKISFNKATGKKITLAKESSDKYPGDGAFTLVNGVQNEKGLARSREFLGWSGPDLDAVIDLGNEQQISEVVVHSLSSGGSWIYPPQYAEVFISRDGKTFTAVGKNDNYVKTAGTNGTIKINFQASSARFVRVFVKSLGIIPDGKSGAGNQAWLFVDEIEVN